MNVLVLIPARSGSKGIPHKNIAPFRGKPLMAHSIEQARASRMVTRTIVSTDSDAYAAIANEYGAETPFRRPPELSDDFSTDLETFQHALDWLEEHERYTPDICVHLRPTYPTRRVEDIDRAVSLLTSDASYDSVRSVVEAPAPPFKMWFLGADESLEPVVTLPSIPEAHSQPRQKLPTAYLQNACVDAVWSRVIRGQRSMSGARIRGMVMDHFHDIDTHTELRVAEALGAFEPPTNKRFAVEIDGVIATIAAKGDLRFAEPERSAIDLVNLLHERGNKIVLFTLRGASGGSGSEAHLRELLERWGVRYDELSFGQVAADYYIDNRHISLQSARAMLGPKAG